MCTLTWLKDSNSYQLFFNRDELNSRQRAIPPRQHEWRGIKVIAPIDTDAGGTWISVNEFSLALCLLNNYGSSFNSNTNTWTSRGLIVRDLASMRSARDVTNHINAMNLSNTKAFDLLVMTLDESPLLISWNGKSLKLIHNPAMPLSSSSFNTDEVIQGRIKQFRDLEESKTINGDVLLDYHTRHVPEKGPYAVCMHREDASTVSFSRICVNNASVDFYYQDGAPCTLADASNCQINRRSTYQQEADKPQEIFV